MPEPLQALLAGDATELLNVDTLCDVFRLSTKAAVAFLVSIGVPIVYIGPAAYFRPGTLDRALFLLTSIKSPWERFAAPGSGYKAKKASHVPSCKTSLSPGEITKLWDSDMEKAYMEAARSRGKTAASTLRKLMAVAGDILGTVEDGLPDASVETWEPDNPDDLIPPASELDPQPPSGVGRHD